MFFTCFFDLLDAVRMNYLSNRYFSIGIIDLIDTISYRLLLK